MVQYLMSMLEAQKLALGTRELLQLWHGDLFALGEHPLNLASVVSRENVFPKRISMADNVNDRPMQKPARWA